MTRREALALLGAIVPVACGEPPPTPPEAPRPAPLHLDPMADLVPAAGLVWLVETRAAELLGNSDLAPAVALVLPPERFDAFAEGHGGVDLRRASQLVLAGYDGVMLAMARTPLQPGRVERAFASRALAVEGRAVEGGVTRFWGSVNGDREQVAVFGNDAVALERGHFGPLRAATYFAQGKLKRALPALRADPLARAAALLGDAPLRAFAPGPFGGEWAAGLGGLLRATTAMAGSATPVARPGGAPALQVLAVLAGAWGADAASAAGRLGAAFQLLANDSLGRLLGLDHPLEEPRVSGDAEALRLDLLLDATALARGVHAATDATIREIMAS
jgi:hypothetical protein